MKKTILLISFLISPLLLAQEIQQQIDSFGGNESLYNKAKALNPEIETQSVQNRFINRTNRFEIASGLSNIFGGDSYNKSQNLGINVYYHLNPRFSVGAKYSYFFNSLTPEGQAMVDRASADAAINPKDSKFLFPQVIYPKSETLAMLNWYPIVGKLSLGDYGVLHFDTYFLAGYGSMQLSSGSSPAETLGVGVGFWSNSKITTRIEYRGQTYRAKYYDKEQNLTTSVASLQVGLIL